MKVEKVLVTPTLAEQFLKQNTKNRRVKEPVVLRYAQDIKNGKWKEDTGEMIKISKTGVILDGQHRLLAVIKAETPTHFHIAFELEDEIFDVLDTGSVRNASDVFKIEGVKNDSIVPSMIAFWYALNNKNYGSGAQKHKRLTNAELLIKYNENAEYWQDVVHKSIFWYNAFSRILPPSFIGGLYARLSEINVNSADSFMHQFCTGMDIENNVIAMLRQKLITDKVSMRRMSQYIKLALVIKTWNFYIKGKEVKNLKFSQDEENYPTFLS